MFLFFQSLCIAKARDNTECLVLFNKLNRSGKLLKIQSSSIVEYVTWRATLCKLIPTGKGNVTVLCDGQTSKGKTAFFWEKKYKNKLIPAYRYCEPQ